MNDLWAALEQQVFEVTPRDDPGYDDARRKLTWNQRLATARTPDAIVAAGSADEVASTIRFARDHDLRISVRGGGHSYEAAALRNAGIMLDLGRLDRVEIDARGKTAWVGSGVQGGNLLDELVEHDLAFPVGHCSDVALSGYILSGGFGWNSGIWGPASANVAAIEMVLASGEIVTASADEHPDLFWAARGAGVRFFAVITAYRLRLQAKPKAAFAWSASFTADSAPILAPWITRATRLAARGAEIACLIGPDHETGDPGISLHVSATGGSDGEARQNIASFFSPPEEATLVREPAGEALAFPELRKLSAMPSGKRVACDHCWFEGSIGDALLAIHHLAGVPDKSSSVNLFAFGGESKVARAPDERESALSVGGGSGAGIYGLWDDAADDDRHLAWVRDVNAALAPLRRGRYVGEASLVEPGRVAECFSPAALERLEGLRTRYDPEGLFPVFA